MSPPALQDLEACVDLLRRGELTEQRLRAAIDAAGKPARRQDILYLQASSTAPDSRVIGMMMVRGGQFDQGPADPAEWPYQSVVMAIADGWRVVQFPNTALMMDDTKTFGLGCEFILERWS